MFVAISEYLKPLEEVDRFSVAHVAWIMKHYASGRFLGSGRRVPPVGGIILARGESQEELALSWPKTLFNRTAWRNMRYLSSTREYFRAGQRNWRLF